MICAKVDDTWLTALRVVHMEANQTATKFAFRLRSAVCRRLIRLSRDPRPASLPFVSGDTFRALADHVFEGGAADMKPESVKDGDVVFVCVRFIREYFSAVHPKIRGRYVLITHNGDESIDENLAGYLDDRIAVWFGQNVTVRNEKIHPIPIGLENLYYYTNGIVKDFLALRKGGALKQDRILYGFSVSNNPAERQPARDALSSCRVAFRLAGWPPPPEYLRTLRGYKFVASPPGNGVDCIRTWEAMLLRTVPVVKRNIIHEYFSGLGLPVLLIDDWHEVLGWNEKFIEDAYRRLEAGFDSPFLMFEPWRRMIKDAADKAKG